MTSTDAQEALDEAMFALSARLKLSGFLDDGANHAAYERVVAVWTNRRTTPTPVTDEREAVARAISTKTFAYCIGGSGDCGDWEEMDTRATDIYLNAADAALSALAPIRAAEILAAEANERARIATFIWDNYSLDGCECDHGIRPPTDCPNENCNVRTAWAIHHSIERNEHGAGK